MDPLSISASIIALLQATTAVISICYDFRACITHAPWSLTRILSEITTLRNILETLEQLSQSQDGAARSDLKRRPVFELLCNPEDGPLVSCERELGYLEEKVMGKGWVEKVGGVMGGKDGGKRRAFVKTVGWRLKDGDARESLDRIERCKNTLSLAISADETTLLLEIHKMNLDLCRGVQSMGDDLSNLVGDLKLKRLDERQKAISEWLSPVNLWESHEAAKNAHQSGTSNWLIESEEFTGWHRADSSFLLLTGFPGAGKTILLRPESQDPINVIGSLVAQLCTQMEYFPEGLEVAFQHSSSGGQKRRPTLSMLIEILVVLAAERKIILLIDALDECDERASILAAIASLEQSDDIKMLITSRAEPEIQDALFFFIKLRIENNLEEVGQDIRQYIEHRLESDRKMLWLKPSIRSDVTESLNSRSHGMFRWVQCQLDEIASLRTIKAIRNALQELPKGLDETYERILIKVSKYDVDIVRKILLWLAFAVLPLTLEELHTAIAIEQDMDELDEDSLLSSPGDILSLCGSLISQSEQGHVRLAHLSVKDYLLSSDACPPTFLLDANHGNCELAIDCLTYLSYKSLANGPSRSERDYIQRLSEHPFIHHSATGWTYYFRATNPTRELDDLIEDFFSPRSQKVFMSWVQVINAPHSSHWHFYPRYATPLYYAASFGLVKMVQDLINTGVDLDAPGSRFGGTALHAAIIRHHSDVIKLLLEAGADPNQADFNQATPLHTAAAHGKVDAATMLLEFGAFKEAVDETGETPYDWAVLRKQVECQQVLLGLPVEQKKTSKEMTGRVSRHDPGDWSSWKCAYTDPLLGTRTRHEPHRDPRG